MTKDEQARARLVEIALEAEEESRKRLGFDASLACADTVRQRAGFRDISTGSWCAAGLTAAMEDAGLVVPAPGTPARRGAVALLDWVFDGRSSWAARSFTDTVTAKSAVSVAQSGDIIAWLQNKAPEQWLKRMSEQHAFATSTSPWSMCGKAGRGAVTGLSSLGRCSSCAWETRKGHVALIVAVESWRIGTVGWNEGPSPGRVQMRWLVRDTAKQPPSKTVLYRRPGGLYGIARPVAR